MSKPAELNPPAPKQDEFAKKFGITWKAALDKGIVFNAVDGCKRLGIDGDKMDKTWVRWHTIPRLSRRSIGWSSRDWMIGSPLKLRQAAAKKSGNLVKFGGGFYAGRLPAPPKVRPLQLIQPNLQTVEILTVQMTFLIWVMVIV